MNFDIITIDENLTKLSYKDENIAEIKLVSKLPELYEVTVKNSEPSRHFRLESAINLAVEIYCNVNRIPKGKITFSKAIKSKRMDLAVNESDNSFEIWLDKFFLGVIHGKDNLYYAREDDIVFTYPNKEAAAYKLLEMYSRQAFIFLPQIKEISFIIRYS